MPGLGNVGCQSSATDYQHLEVALSDVRTWLCVHNTLAKARADLAELAVLLRRLWAPLKAAKATGTLWTWKIAPGVDGWADRSWDAQVMQTAAFFEDIKDANGPPDPRWTAEQLRERKTPEQTAEQHTRLLGVLLGRDTQATEGTWIDFQAAFSAYAKEVLDAVVPNRAETSPAWRDALPAIYNGVQTLHRSIFSPTPPRARPTDKVGFGVLPRRLAPHTLLPAPAADPLGTPDQHNLYVDEVLRAAPVDDGYWGEPLDRWPQRATRNQVAAVIGAGYTLEQIIRGDASRILQECVGDTEGDRRTKNLLRELLNGFHDSDWQVQVLDEPSVKRQWLARLNELRGQLQAAGRKGDRPTGPEARRKHVEKRRDLIDQMLSAGETDFGKIYAHLKKEYSELLYRNKDGKADKKGGVFITPRTMELDYRKHRPSAQK
jgi:hypothetical protein